MKNNITLFLGLLTLSIQIDAQTVSDYDGNIYNTVTIGTQIWLKENLKSTHYTDGTSIMDVYSYNNDTSNVSVYGRLYGWSAAMKNDTTQSTQGVCPVGWHLPSKSEWETLINYLGGDNAASGKMKESGTTHWLSPNTGANNSSNFTALPAGYKEPLFVGGNYANIQKNADFWTSSSYSPNFKWQLSLRHNDNIVHYAWVDPIYLSVRCLNDTLTGLNQIEKINKQELIIYPNPSTNTLNITNITQKTIIHLYDKLGKLIFETETESDFTLDISHLTQGIYTIELEDNKGRTFNKVVITK